MQRECRWRGQGLAVPWEPPRERRGEMPPFLSSGLHSINPPEETLFGKKQESSWGGGCLVRLGALEARAPLGCGRPGL